MKRITGLALAGAATFALVACGGVDRDGTRDLYIDQLEQAGFTADADCVDAVLADYTDDELKDFDKMAEDGETSDEAEAFGVALFDCASESGS